MVSGLIILSLVTLLLNLRSNNSIHVIRTRSMLMSIVGVYIILWEILTYNYNNCEYQNRENILNINIGIDGLNMGLIILIMILEPILILISKTYEQEKQKRIINKIIIIKIIILLIFSTMDLIIFYITFELILIPIFFIITYYGSKYNYLLPRLEASYRFIIYTIIGSIWMLLAIIIIQIKYGTTNNELILYKFNNTDNLFLLQILWFFFYISFLVKIPSFPFHTWLPAAHAEAPTIGSVILAGILLKLGTYGILRYNIYVYSNVLEENISIYRNLLPIIFIISLISIIYSTLLSLRSLFDLKKLIAYSSIIHMNFSIFGLFSFDLYGLFGANLLIYSHAFISSCLFLLIGYLYNRTHTRNLLYLNSISIYMPIFSLFFLYFSFANLSIPIYTSFLSELLILISCFHFNLFLTIFLLFTFILSSSFFIWFTNRLLYGNPNRKLSTLITYDLSSFEFYSLLPFTVFSVLFTFFPKPLFLLFTLPLLNFI